MSSENLPPYPFHARFQNFSRVLATSPFFTQKNSLRIDRGVSTTSPCSQASSFFGIFLESFHVADCDTSHIDWSGCHLPTLAPDALLVQQYDAPLQLFWSFCLLLARYGLLPLHPSISFCSPGTHSDLSQESASSYVSTMLSCKISLLLYLS